MSEKQTNVLSIKCEDKERVACVEYTWVSLFDIEKRVPESVTLAKPDGEGCFWIPAEPGCATVLILRVTYVSGDRDCGLVTAKRLLSDEYANSAKGHKVNRLSFLARAPLAWVKLHAATSRRCFPSVAYAGHQPETVVSRIYTSLIRYAHMALDSHDTDNRDSVVANLVGDTLAALGAPLAFKAVYEQTRLSLPESHDGPVWAWGTRATWTSARAAGADATRTLRVDSGVVAAEVLSSAHRYTRIALTRAGIEVVSTHCLGVAAARDTIRAPYWAVVLTALCSGAADVWSREFTTLSSALRVPADVEGSCERCGRPYSESPRAFDGSRVTRTTAVLQLDRLILGAECASLCAEVKEEPEHAARGGRGYCLNHRRTYAVSAEELWELGRTHNGEVADERTRSEEGTDLVATEPRSTRDSVAAWWSDSTAGKCYWGQESGHDGDRVSAEDRRGRRRRREEPLGDRRGETLANKKRCKDRGLWAWQKACRNPGLPGGEGFKHRLWDVWLDAEPEGRATGLSSSLAYWKRFSCQVLGYHTKVVPFGHQGGLLALGL